MLTNEELEHGSCVRTVSIHLILKPRARRLFIAQSEHGIRIRWSEPPNEKRLRPHWWLSEHHGIFLSWARRGGVRYTSGLRPATSCRRSLSAGADHVQLSTIRCARPVRRLIAGGLSAMIWTTKSDG
jgi:hypothetical protein